MSSATSPSAGASQSQWQQRATKFREHLSFISTTPSQPALKSHWSPSTTIHSASSSPTLHSTTPPPVPEMPSYAKRPEPIKLTDWKSALHDVDLDLERNVPNHEREREHEHDRDRESEAGPSSFRPSRFTRFSFWRGGNNHAATTNDTASVPETPASIASSFIPARLATWRPLNILRPAPPRPALPTTNTVTTHNNTTHEVKPVHIHTHVNVPQGASGTASSSSRSKLHHHHHEKRVKEKKKSRKWLILLIIVLLYLLGNNIFLNVKVSQLSNPSSGSGSGGSGTGSGGASKEVTDCLSQFTLNAASNPTSYPCSSCAPILQGVPNDLSPSTKNPQTTGQGAVLQFCALADIASATANNTLQNVGWMKDADPCGSWAGVSCDSAGRVTSLTLVFPGVPATLSASLATSLVGLQTLSITGDGTLPAASASLNSTTSLFSIPSLRTLSLQSTALTGPLPDAAFAATPNLTSVTLVNNAKLGSTVPSSLFALNNLTSLVVNGQGLTSASSLSPSSKVAGTLHTLDLSNNALSGPLPDFSAFTSLVELNLASNQFTALTSSPSNGGDGFPGTLQTLNIAKNSGLSGSVPGALCTLAGSVLGACDFRDTQLGLNGGNATTGMCGSCLFGSE